MLKVLASSLGLRRPPLEVALFIMAAIEKLVILLLLLLAGLVFTAEATSRERPEAALTRLGEIIYI